MPHPAAAARRGRRGRRTGVMVRIARERIDDLFGLAAVESRRGPGPVPDRCVALARRIGTRYNVRLLIEYHDLFCRGCSSYWIEGRTVRTRVRDGIRVRTCLRCGRIRRVPLRRRAGAPELLGLEGRSRAGQVEVALAEEEALSDPAADEGEEE